jgi:hypothetical protein
LSQQQAVYWGVLTAADIAHFRAFGFLVLRRALDPSPLAHEFDRSLREGVRTPFQTNVGGEELGGTYVPMMCERTPVSLSLLDRFMSVAQTLLHAEVVPVRAKGVRYFGATSWHTDSVHNLASVGFVAYLESLRGTTGALRVIPGSHRPEFGSALAEYLAGGASPDTESAKTPLPSFIVDTEPGDLLVFDEHLYHASSGGQNRRQWRVDYVAVPARVDEEASVRTYFESVYQPGWDGGYDAELFPTYGPHWLLSGRACVARLADLGVYAIAARSVAP